MIARYALLVGIALIPICLEAVEIKIYGNVGESRHAGQYETVNMTQNNHETEVRSCPPPPVCKQHETIEMPQCPPPPVITCKITESIAAVIERLKDIPTPILLDELARRQITLEKPAAPTVVLPAMPTQCAHPIKPMKKTKPVKKTNAPKKAKAKTVKKSASVQTVPCQTTDIKPKIKPVTECQPAVPAKTEIKAETIATPEAAVGVIQSDAKSTK